MGNIVITGAAGFIGSNLVASLNEQDFTNLLLVDHLNTEAKKQNLNGLIYKEYLEKDVFLEKIKTKSLPKVDIIIHLGATSDTREYNESYLRKNNYMYSKVLFEYATQENCQFIYASSASVYGDGKKGFHESQTFLRPLNPYGYYKYLFDKWVRKQKHKPLQWVGLRFFNVYGPHELHKGAMASVILHAFKQIQDKGEVSLFKSYKKEYKDGEQRRDFVYVKDVVSIIFFFIQHKEKSGIFNVGTGQSRTFLDLVHATFASLSKPPQVTFIPMPEKLRDKYQYDTKADMKKLYNIGYEKPFTSLEVGVKDYVQNYLLPQKKI